MKKKVSILMLILLAVFMMCPTLTASAATSKIDIYDNADFFTPEEETELFSYIQYLFYDDIGMDVVVLTEPFDPDNEVKYTDDFYDNNGYGKDGVLFFVSENVYYINTVGYGIIAISDEEVEYILDDGYPGFENYDFYSCIKSMLASANTYIEYAYNNGYVDNSIDTDIVPVVPHKQNSPSKKPFAEAFSDALVPTGTSVIVILCITIMTVILLVSKHKNFSAAQSAKVYLAENFTIINMNKRYMGTRETVQHNYYKPNTSSSSGHSSGSSHRSSSGVRHGGGGRRR